MGHPSYRVRPVTRADLAGVAKLASELVQFHHELDPRRFFHVDNAEEGYAWWLGTQLGNPSSAVVCAVDDADRVVGYAYGTKEGRDWNMLVDEHGIVHDVLVERSARRAGVGEMLLKDVCARLRALGAPRVLLYTAVNNTAARSLFARIGFRETMVEMTREGDDGG